MQQTQPAPLSGDVDPEVFRRVWSRVMADEEHSPIAVEPGSEAPAPAAMPEPAVQNMQEIPEPVKRSGADDGTLLKEGLEGLIRGLSLSQALARRWGGRGAALTALTADYRRAARQLGTAYFLTTGERCAWAGKAPGTAMGLARGLRELYWWERDWSGQCLRAAAQAEDDYVQQLFGRLSQTGQIHLGIIRGALEQMETPGLDGGRTRGVN
ncbi:hypothetical protein DWX58_11150 [Pseudoflavonifractor sp. AF19-9AC]|uniref:hypothetical protein n=1 Tax=Pseudoflavonifractor sp. AF19-9AC TaxID=2292244 RepID=UPI000E4A6791|nr:hypothetical protein [Pseudoflavonifractor sp. AF19-9AC]RHR07410.1 hypothetical protein DWX58_11150 [Pseudoflavonifractor sp. AF19-9AC]